MYYILGTIVGAIVPPVHTTVQYPPHQDQATSLVPYHTTSGTIGGTVVGVFQGLDEGFEVVLQRFPSRLFSRFHGTLCTTYWVPYTPLVPHHTQHHVYLSTLGLGYTYYQQQVQYWYTTSTPLVQIGGQYEGFEVVCQQVSRYLMHHFLCTIYTTMYTPLVVLCIPLHTRLRLYLLVVVGVVLVLYWYSIGVDIGFL